MEEQQLLEDNYMGISSRVKDAIYYLGRVNDSLKESNAVIAYKKDGEVLRSIINKATSSISQLKNFQKRVLKLREEITIPWKKI